REALPDRLRAAGAQVDVVPVYETRSAPEAAAARAAIEAGEIDAVTFASSSTARHFLAALGLRAPEAPGGGQDGPGDPRTRVTRAAMLRVCRASIGPVTSETLARWGFPATVEAARSTLAGLVEALESYFAPTGARS